MNRIDEQVREIVTVQLGAEAVAPEARLLEELGAESADLLNLVAALEDRFAIEIAEEEIPGLATVADVQELVRARLAGGDVPPSPAGDPDPPR